MGLDVDEVIEGVGTAVEVVGVALIVIAVVVGLLRYVLRAATGADRERAYERCRGELGRGILLGLEVLVAGDIIRTVGVSPSFRSVGVLAVIVLVRTFLSWTIEVETEGRWPWQRAVEEPATAP